MTYYTRKHLVIREIIACIYGKSSEEAMTEFCQKDVKILNTLKMNGSRVRDIFIDHKQVCGLCARLQQFRMKPGSLTAEQAAVMTFEELINYYSDENPLTKNGFKHLIGSLNEFIERNDPVIPLAPEALTPEMPLREVMDESDFFRFIQFMYAESAPDCVTDLYNEPIGVFAGVCEMLQQSAA